MRRLLPFVAAVALAAPAGATPPPFSAEPNLKAVANLKYTGGTDLEIVKIKGRRYVVAGAQNNYNPNVGLAGLRVVDVTNPAKPKVAGFLPCNTSQNDIQVRGTTAFLAVDGNAKGNPDDKSDCYSQLRGMAPKVGVVVVDLANPAKPRAVGFVDLKTGAHNTTVHPTKPVLLISESESLAVPKPDPNAMQPIYVVDVSKPKTPKIVNTITLGPGDSAHDITFNTTGTRAYVAAGFTGATFILDTANAHEPKVLGRIYDPAINFAHQADPVPGDKYVLVTDELIGASGNPYCPGGGLHVWDVSNPAAPLKVGAFFIPDTFPSADPGPRPNPVGAGPKLFRCTAHVMKMTPNGKTLVMGWYSQGVQVLDISALTGISTGAGGSHPPGVPGIKRIANWTTTGADTWSAKMDDRNYIYTGDTQRGMDVLKFDPKAARTATPGEWLTPQQALFRGLKSKAMQDPDKRTYLCFERATRLGV
ncbi:MAG TPA: hypothetical protein VNA20_02910 [Frankiaceae bacterium]|nr:hypothetical protein [Frankiaceae bacterium]